MHSESILLLLTVTESDGLLMIEEADPVLYRDNPPPEDGPGHNISNAMNASGWLGQANRMYAGFPLAAGFVVE